MSLEHRATLYSEKPVVCDQGLAALLGTDMAMVLTTIQALITDAVAGNTAYAFDNRHWVHGSLVDWHKQHFWHLTHVTFKRIITRLRKKGILLARSFNSNGLDSTLSYAIDHEQLGKYEQLACETHSGSKGR